MEKTMVMAMSLIVLALILSPSGAVMTCQEALTRMYPCMSFLQGKSKMTATCCLAAQGLDKAAATKPDRQGVCVCFEKVWNSLQIKPENAKRLPGMCGIKLNVIVTPNTDCSKVK